MLTPPGQEASRVRLRDAHDELALVHLDVAVDHVLDVERVEQPGGAEAVVHQRGRGVRVDDAHLGHRGQIVDDLVRERLAEVVELGVARAILEGHDRERRLPASAGEERG